MEALVSHQFERFQRMGWPCLLHQIGNSRLLGWVFPIRLGAPEAGWEHICLSILEIPRKWEACTPPSDWEYPKGGNCVSPIRLGILKK